MYKLLIIFGLLFLMISHSCHSTKNTVTTHTIPLEKKSTSTYLYYTGIIQPLDSQVISSPAEGIIQKMNFHYGDPVKKNQMLFIIESEKFQSDYKEALTLFLKAKTDLSDKQSKLDESDFLYKNKLISRDDFKTAHANFYSSQLSFLQAKDGLSVFIKKMDTKNNDLLDLSIENFDKITTALHRQDGLRHIAINSPVDGVILSPNKTSGSDKKLESGSSIKQNDLLAFISDGNGISIKIDINEFEINKFKNGQPVTITSPAFPELIIQGKVQGIELQAQTGQSGSPTFNAQVVVDKLSAEQKAIIHMGMSVKVEINLQSEPAIIVPLNAIINKNGKSFISLKKANTNKIEELEIQTGETTATGVVITTNLNQGDTLVYTDTAATAN